ncbi:MAG: tyrosine-type recombinase/integrase [Rhizobiaceae bacterium]|nr:tyrosine-type recombinase/integrase [Rhizobiaceae bacterium]
MKAHFRYVVEDVDRHGNVRLYFRRKGQPKVRLPGPPGSPDFNDAYRAALEGRLSEAKTKVGEIIPGSLRELCIKYYTSADYLQLDPRTQRTRRSILDRFCQNKNDGDKPYRLLDTSHIISRRDAMIDRPEAANGMVKTLRLLFNFAIKAKLVTHNPASGIKKLEGNPEGFHSWTPDEIAQFEAVFPIGTKARLALALALYTGQRRSDLAVLGKQHVRNGWLVFTQFKGRNRRPVKLEIPIAPELQRIIDATECGELTFLVTEYGRPFTADGLGNKFQEWRDEAGLPSHCALHGLRKAAAARLAEAGCTEREIMSITGHQSSQEVDRYVKAANQKLRAGSAMRKLLAEQN